MTALILATSDETELQIDCNRLPDQLEKFFRQKVIVDGEWANSNLLKIRKIEICKADPPPLKGASERFDWIR